MYMNCGEPLASTHSNTSVDCAPTPLSLLRLDRRLQPDDDDDDDPPSSSLLLLLQRAERKVLARPSVLSQAGLKDVKEDEEEEDEDERDTEYGRGAPMVLRCVQGPKGDGAVYTVMGDPLPQ
jgi:hypothetical protein